MAKAKKSENAPAEAVEAASAVPAELSASEVETAAANRGESAPAGSGPTLAQLNAANAEHWSEQRAKEREAKAIMKEAGVALRRGEREPDKSRPYKPSDGDKAAWLAHEATKGDGNHPDVVKRAAPSAAE